MKRVVCLSVAVLLIAAFAVQAQPSRPGGTGVNANKIGGAEVVGQLRYDTGAPQDLARGPGAFEIVGNRFNSNNGNPLLGGSASAFSLYARIGGGITAVVSFFGQPAGGTASILAVIYAAPFSPLTFNAFSFTPVAVGDDFLAGQYLPNIGGGTGYIGMNTDSYNGQGFHAFQGNWAGATTLTGYTSIGGENAMLRVTGDLIPVELMNFDVE